MQAQVYRAIKQLDPFHITAGAVNGACAAAFTDGEGPDGSRTLSLDVPLNENYNPNLSARTAPGASENAAKTKRYVSLIFVFAVCCVLLCFCCVLLCFPMFRYVFLLF